MPPGAGVHPGKQVLSWVTRAPPLILRVSMVVSAVRATKPASVGMVTCIVCVKHQAALEIMCIYGDVSRLRGVGALCMGIMMFFGIDKWKVTIPCY